ncbi:alcohol dehydrogenase catalytic domain-containing protein, partial [Klebsiella pneumoniae]|uniref:alcohol dehydrogenase catalytic domain-containing protein n=1 Tax=Klebsiella pneumoniae TaxID=573 RepID=UPI001F50A781
MTSMNTLVCQEPKKLHWEKRQIPIPGDDEVLIKIKAVGICGTDIHAWGGNQPFFRESANKQVISSQADSLIKISRIWAD